MADVPDTTEVVAAELHYQDDRHENCERVCVRRARQAIAADREALADAGYTVASLEDMAKARVYDELAVSLKNFQPQGVHLDWVTFDRQAFPRMLAKHRMALGLAEEAE